MQLQFLNLNNLTCLLVDTTMLGLSVFNNAIYQDKLQLTEVPEILHMQMVTENNWQPLYIQHPTFFHPQQCEIDCKEISWEIQRTRMHTYRDSFIY